MSTEFIIYAFNKASIAIPTTFYPQQQPSWHVTRQSASHQRCTIFKLPDCTAKTHTHFILILPLHTPILTLLSKRTILFKIHPQYSTELYTLVTHLSPTNGITGARFPHLLLHQFQATKLHGRNTVTYIYHPFKMANPFSKLPNPF